MSLVSSPKLIRPKHFVPAFNRATGVTSGPAATAPFV
jgi:hypothetical protein